MTKKRDTTTHAKPKVDHNRKLLLYYFFIVAFGLSYHLISNTDWFLSLAKPIFHGYASLSSGILKLLGQETSAIGDQINSAAFSLRIKEGCDGITPMILYSVAVIAFPVHFTYKWKGAVYGILTLFLLNVIRIVTLFFFGKFGSERLFDIMHEDIWSILYLVIAVILWLTWMKWAIVTKSGTSK